MGLSIEITSIDDQISLLPQTEKDEVEGGRTVDHLIDIINKMFEDLDNSSFQSRTIFKVNAWVRESSPASYTPKMVSIGPYHKKNPQLGPMENYKLLYLRRFLQRNKRLDVKSYISELEELKEKVLKCYEDIEDDSQFCQMLLLDGCFVVEFIRERCQMCPEGEEEIINFASQMYHQVFRDLMMLENQLPFFVLDKLHHMTKQDDELPLLLLANVSFIFFMDLPIMIRLSFPETELCDAEREVKHILHLVHISSCHGQKKKAKSTDFTNREQAMPNATELSEAGVKFVERPYVNASLFDITFDKGLMRIPHFEVFDYTETFLRNLIAYEQQSCDVYPTYFSDYATFMDNLIDSDKDVNLLRKEKIIENWMGEDKQVASFFNKIGNGVIVYSNFYYSEEFDKVVKHSDKRRNKTMANLKHNYFSSFWVGASTLAPHTHSYTDYSSFLRSRYGVIVPLINSIVATITLLVLTVMQTVLRLLVMLISNFCCNRIVD